MANPYPIPREARSTGVLSGNGGASYGPFGFKIFDTADVEVITKPDGAEGFSVVAVTVAKVSGAALDHFTITFPAALPATTKFQVRGRRVHERSAGVTAGTKLSPDALERELSKQAATLEELRRDALDIDPDIEDGQSIIRKGNRLIGGPSAELIASIPAIAAATEGWRDEAKAFAKLAEQAEDLAEQHKQSAQASATAAAESLSSTRAAAQKAEAAVLFEGAPLKFELPDPVPADGTRVILSTEAGTQGWEVVGGAWVFKNWIGKVEFNTPQELKNFTGPLGPNYTRIGAGPYSYSVVPPGSTAGGTDGFHFATAGGWLLRTLPGDDGVYNFESVMPSSADTSDPDTYNKFMMLLEAGVSGTGSYQSSAPIYLPNNVYYMSDTINLKRSVRIFGNASGMPYSSTAQMVFPEDTIGIVVNRSNTLSTGLQSPATTAADSSTLEGFNILSTCGSDKTAHGIWLRARAVVKNMLISSFSGNGVHIRATSGSSDPLAEGNANVWYSSTLRIQNCGGHGFYVDGADVNAGIATAINCANNGRSGIYDSSFLGNTYIGCHVASNGLAGMGNNSTSQSSFVSYGGSRYAAHWEATEAELVSTTPGTDDTVWVRQGAGGVHSTIPLWQSGQPEGTYFRAFSYQTDNNNARNVFIGCYSEGGAAGAAFAGGPTLAIGGLIEPVLVGNFLRASSNGQYTLSSLSTEGADYTASLNVSGALSFSSTEDAPGDYWGLVFDPVEKLWWTKSRNLDSRTAHFLTAAGFNGREFTFGVPAAFYLGASVDTRVLMNTWSAGSGSFPSSGTYERRQIGFGRYPTPGGKIGWICTTGGTAGSTAVFKEFGAIDP
ncbi:right-handed parallel beta-helix repeat-containing protein [Martelella sp. FOR1707]